METWGKKYELYIDSRFPETAVLSVTERNLIASSVKVRLSLDQLRELERQVSKIIIKLERTDPE